MSTAPASGNGKSTIEVRHNGVGPVPAAPATRRLARELNLDLRMISGSGPSGRVTKEDVRSFAAGSLEGTISGASSQTHPIESKQHSAPAVVQSLASKYGESGGKAAPLTEAGMGAAPIDLPDFTKFGAVERVPLKGIRRKIAQNMMQSWTHIPHVTTFDEADVTSLDAYRAKYESEVKQHGGRLTLTVFALKAIASGLKKYPQFNASLDEKTSARLVFKALLQHRCCRHGYRTRFDRSCDPQRGSEERHRTVERAGPIFLKKQKPAK